MITGPRYGLFVALPVLLLAACASQKPRWTPQSVAVPEELEAALEGTNGTGAAPFRATLDKWNPPVAEATAESREDPQEAVDISEAAELHPVPLTRDGAILSALARNRAFAVQKYDIDIAQTEIQVARAAFDPAIQSSITYSESNSPLGGAGNTLGSQLNTFVVPLPGTNPANPPSRADNISTLSQEVTKLTQVAEIVGSGGVQVARNRSADATVSTFLPTGTEVFLSGGLSKSSASVAEDDSYQGDWTVGLTQSLLRGFGPAVNLVTLRQSRNAAGITEQGVRGTALDLVRDVENAYWNLVLALESLGIRQFSADLSAEQLELNKAFISVGKLAESDQVSAEAALAASKADLVDAKAQVRTRTIDIWRLLNPETAPGEEVYFLPQEPPDVARIEEDLATSIRLGQIFRPDFAQARLNLANRDLDIVRAKNGVLPQLDLTANYGGGSAGTSANDARRFVYDDRFDNYQVGIVFGMSLTNRAERANRLRAEYQLDQAEASLQNLEQLIEADLRLAVVEINRQWERIAATQQEVRSREEEYGVEQDQFRLGRSTNLDVLQVQQSLIQAKLNEVSARVAYIQSLTNLYHAEGTLLARRGVNFATASEN